MKLLSVEQLIGQIHDSPTRIVLSIAGGGSRAIADLLEVPGASRTLFEAVVPYSPAAMTAWLGSLPDGLCSAATGRAMAMVAFLRARQYEEGTGVGGQGPGSNEHSAGGWALQCPVEAVVSGQWAVGSRQWAVGSGQSAAEGGEWRVESGEPLPHYAFPPPSSPPSPNPQIHQSPNPEIPKSPTPQIPPALAGVSCTASLASDRPKRGPHRIHIALQTVSATAAWHIQLQKDRRSRAEEERLAGRLLLNVVADACGVSERLSLDLLEGEQLEESRVHASAAWQDLLLGQTETVRVGPAGESPRAIMPGAFNPLHDGHRRMMQIAGEILGQPPAAEISILNVNKPPLDYIEIERRLGQFPADRPVLLSRAATFEEKSRLFAGATFIVGTDTLRRIADPRYYGGDPLAAQRASERIAARGCRFLVFGRTLGAGFVRLSDLDLSDQLRAICREVPPGVFRADISSTALRNSAET